MDLFGEFCLQDVMWNAVEEVMNVHFENIFHILWIGIDPFFYSFLCFMLAASCRIS